MFSLPVLILYIRDEYSLNYQDSGILWTFLITLMTISSLFTGLFADNHPKYRFHLIYFGLFVMILIWYSFQFVSTYREFLLLFSLFGLGASAFHPPSFAMITELFEGKKGKALSINMVIGMIGTAISPLLFAILHNYLGNWKTVSKTIAQFTLYISIVSFIYFIISNKKQLLFTYNISEPSNLQDTSNNSFKSELKFIFAPLIIIPLLFVSIRSRFFRTASLFTSLIYEDYLNLSKFDSSIATAIVLGFSSLFTVVGGFISDRNSPKNVILISSIGTLFFSSIIAFFINFSNLFQFSFAYLLLLSLYYIGSPAASTLIANRAGKAKRGRVFGASFSLGQFIGI
ncbi:MAG: MFS transporter, partial [Candidatus Heimdallarchaeota archaeon]|nr:MFS transporter [Candidatus Heimdallarchaeota archaeon]